MEMKQKRVMNLMKMMKKSMADQKFKEELLWIKMTLRSLMLVKIFKRLKLVQRDKEMRIK
jgi:hypothetical protein